MGNIQSPRTGCALHGALSTLEAIGGVIPIIQSNAGCVMQHYLSTRRASGGYIDGLTVPAANIIDKQVIFGGGSRLREQIKNTIKVIDGRLYVALGSCECAMVGDDLTGMVQEAVEQGLPVAGSNVAGFFGNIHAGYERVFLDLIDSLANLPALPEEDSAYGPLVNLFGIFPGSNPYYKGDLTEIRRILEGIGLRVNSFFGPDGAEELQRIPRASLNLIFSRWGVEIGEKLEQTRGTAQLRFNALPLGFEEVRQFVDLLVERLDLDESVAGRFLSREKAQEAYFLLGSPERYFDEGVGKTAAIVGDTETVFRIGGYLAGQFGVKIKLAVLTDWGEDEILPEGLPWETHATSDTGAIRTLLVASGADLILGSSLEEDTAHTLGAAFLPVAHPVQDRAITRKTYAGVWGGLTLAEDYLSVAQRIAREDESRLTQEISDGAASLALASAIDERAVIRIAGKAF